MNDVQFGDVQRSCVRWILKVSMFRGNFHNMGENI